MEGFNKVEESKWWSPEYEAIEDIPVNYFGVNFVIKKGFRTDFVTRPKLLKYFFRSKKYAKSALLHDWLYEHKLFSKVLSDALFYQQLKDSNVKSFIRSSMFAIVLCCGGKRWKN